jgi:hypothetical protein
MVDGGELQQGTHRLGCTHAVGRQRDHRGVHQEGGGRDETDVTAIVKNTSPATAKNSAGLVADYVRSGLPDPARRASNSA